MDLKRRSEAPSSVNRKSTNSTKNPPLFEKYQFFTPGKSQTRCWNTIRPSVSPNAKYRYLHDSYHPHSPALYPGRWPKRTVKLGSPVWGFRQGDGTRGPEEAAVNLLTYGLCDSRTRWCLRICIIPAVGVWRAWAYILVMASLDELGEIPGHFCSPIHSLPSRLGRYTRLAVCN
jgi:hypothetical protein